MKNKWILLIFALLLVVLAFCLWDWYRGDRYEIDPQVSNWTENAMPGVKVRIEATRKTCSLTVENGADHYIVVDIPEKQQCAALIVNGGLDAYKAFFNSYTLNEEDNFADKYNVTFTKATGNANKILSTKEEVNGKKSGLHLKYPILDEAYSKGLLPYYKFSE